MKRIATDDLKDIYHHTKNLWEDLRGKTIFITGATGFFGKWLLESFIYVNNRLSLNAKVVALSRNPNAFLAQYSFYSSETCVSFIKGDVQNFEFPQGSFSYIIHAATDADATMNNENPLLMLDTISGGTRRVLEFAKTQSLQSFLLISSGAVYGKQPQEVILTKEQDSFFIDINNTASAYTEGKRIAELYCTIYHKKFDVPIKIARCFAFVGPYLPLTKHFAIGNFIKNSLLEEDILIKGDGSAFRSYMYAVDLVIWLWTILIKGKNNHPYNVGSSEGYNLKTIAEKVKEVSTNSKVKVLGFYKEGTAVERYVPSTELIENELGLKLSIPLKESIKRTILFNKRFSVYE